MQATDVAVAGLPDATAVALKAVLDELQGIAGGGTLGIKTAVLAGAGAATPIALTGIKTTDKILGFHEFVVGVDTGTSASGNKVSDVVDLTSTATIPSNGNVQSSTSTSGSKVLVIWLDLTP